MSLCFAQRWSSKSKLSNVKNIVPKPMNGVMKKKLFFKRLNLSLEHLLASQASKFLTSSKKLPHASFCQYKTSCCWSKACKEPLIVHELQRLSPTNFE